LEKETAVVWEKKRDSEKFQEMPVYLQLVVEALGARAWLALEISMRSVGSIHLHLSSFLT